MNCLESLSQAGVGLCVLPLEEGDQAQVDERGGLGLPIGERFVDGEAVGQVGARPVDILISGGQHDATMKGCGDTSDNIPCLLELPGIGVLSPKEAVVSVMCNPAALMAERAGKAWWAEAGGHLGEGALANVTVIDEKDRLATLTLANGHSAAFENRAVRRGNGAGGWVSKHGMVKRTGIGDLATHSFQA